MTTLPLERTILTRSPHLRKQVWENASQLGGNPAAFFSIGGSAGAGLALAVANHYAQRADGRKYIKGVVALVPLALHWDNVPAEYKGDYTSYDDNADNVPVIDKSTMESFYRKSSPKSLIQPYSTAYTYIRGCCGRSK